MSPQSIKLAAYATLVALTLPNMLARAVDTPAVPTGNWQVIEVHIDEWTTRRQSYGPHDPLLRYRLVKIQPGFIAFDSPAYETCEQAKWKPHDLPLGKLWRISFESSHDPKNWNFTLSERQVVRAFELACTNTKMFGDPLLWYAKGTWPGTWFLPLRDGRLALRWYDQTLLILKRLAPDQRPKASFDCTKAKTPAERTICSTHTLAGLDRSVAEQYSIVYDYAIRFDRPDMAQRFHSEQVKWLATRDACGTDAACLDKSMRMRLDELSAEPG